MLAPHGHAIHNDGPVDAGVQVAAPAVVAEERVQLSQQAHRPSVAQDIDVRDGIG
jgi:hypothetical protein